MKIVIIGAGAVGGYFGTRLHKAGADVTFFVRERRAEQLRKHGLLIDSVKGNTNWDVPSFETDPKAIQEANLVILATKGYHLQDTISLLKSVVGPNTYTLPLLNGVKHYHLLAELFGKEKVIGGLANIVATLNEKGHVIHTSKVDRITFGALHESQKVICEELASLAKEANMQVSWTDSIHEAIWNKYMFITAFSGITTAADVATGAIRQENAAKNVFIRLLIEMKQLAEAERVLLTDKDVETAIDALEHLPGDATSSMHQDFRKGLAIEVEHLQGFAIQLAKDHHLKVPTLETVYGIIKAKTYQRQQN